MSDKRKPSNPRREVTPGKPVAKGPDGSPRTAGDRRAREERSQAERTLHDADAVRDDARVPAIPHGEPSGSTAALHETSDVGLKILIAAGAIVGGLVIVALIVVRLLTGAFYSSPDTQPQGGSPIETAAPPAAVEMRVNPLSAWQRYRATADAELNGYGWVDQNAGVARIPIERAMSLLTEGVQPVTGVQGTPVPTATPAADGS